AWEGAPSSLLWLRPRCHADALWAAEQILRSGTFGAVLLWQDAVRVPLLRRLHLSAQCGDTLFAVFRPISAAAQPCPAPLRLCLHPAPRGLKAVILKRRGSPINDPIFLPLHSDTRLPDSPHHVPVARHSSLAYQPGPAVSRLAN
ncbi:MAG: cell division protein, partial [Candidimonas sp.]